MDNQEEVTNQEPLNEEVLGNQEVGNEVVEEVVESEREKNLKAENSRKTQEIQRLREELDAKKPKAQEKFNPQDLTTWKDHELKAVMKDQQYAALHDQASELLEHRRFQRFHNEREESLLRMNAELERQKKYPETLDPTHPMAVRMSELMLQHRLDHTPSGRLVAAQLAASELKQQKAVAAGRKQEQNRQADVNANFSGEAARPTPKVSDKNKLEELKKRALSGDAEAKAQWFKIKGLI